MKNILMAAIVALCFVGAAGLIQATDNERYEGRERITIDHEALKGMTWEERREYMRAYKEAREAEAERAGVIVESGGFTRLETPRKVDRPEKSRVPGSNITYDSGTVFGTAGVASRMLGNRFDSALNTAGTACCFPVETSGSITMITFDLVNTFFSSAVFSIYSNVMGTTAARVTSMARGGVMTGLNVLSVMTPTTANAYMNGTFLAGIFQFQPASTGLAVDTGTNLGQGFHAISINDGTVGTMLTTLTSGGAGLNAVFRVSGNVSTPVELMSFTIAD